jgi:hypothetical protein
VCPDRPFGVGLRLSARAARELVASGVPELRRWLDERGLYVFTINGFPHGVFHGTAVKEAVYRPDWLEPERLAYTQLLGELLAQLLPDGIDGTISTAPGYFHAREQPGARAVFAAQLARAGDSLAAIARRTGRRIVLAVEPEPACTLETMADAIDVLAPLAHDHVGVCIDVCHAAVEFEPFAASLAGLERAGIRVAKLQLGCGLAVAPVGDDARTRLAAYVEGVYLHQVVARAGDALVRFVDLPEALADSRAFDEWRIHFHVPIFRDQLGALASTQAYLADVLALHRERPIAPHLEVETYTWDVLPAEFRGEPIEDAIARELRWVMERLS